MKIYEDASNPRYLGIDNEIWGNFQGRILHALVPVRKVIGYPYVEHKIYEGIFALIYGFISLMLEGKRLMPLQTFESISKWSNPEDLRCIAERDTGLVDNLGADMPLSTGVRLLENPDYVIPYSAVGRKYVLDENGKLMILDIIHDSYSYFLFWTHVSKYQSINSKEIEKDISTLKDPIGYASWLRLLNKARELEVIRKEYPDCTRIVVIRPSALATLSSIMGYSCDHLPDYQNDQGLSIPLKEHAGLYKHKLVTTGLTPIPYPDDISYCSDEEFLKLAKIYDPTLNNANCKILLFDEFVKLYFTIDDLVKWRSIRDEFIDKLADEVLDSGNRKTVDRAREYLKTAKELMEQHPNESIINAAIALEMVLKAISYRNLDEKIDFNVLVKMNSEHPVFKNSVVEANFIRKKRNQALHSSYRASFREAEDVYYKTNDIFKRLTGSP